MQSAASSTMAGDLMSSVATGRDSVMSQSGNMDAMSADPNARRSSDPGRPLDRQFGVGGQMSRHRSFGNLGGQPGRPALHNQRIRGQAGPGFMPDHQNPGQEMYDPMRMYGMGGGM